MKIKKGDQVVVIAGNGKNRHEPKTVLSVDRASDRVLVEGVNLRWKHKRPTQSSPQGERVQEECPIHASNVMIWDAATKQPVRKRAVQEK